jgi:hypothetical protein
MVSWGDGNGRPGPRPRLIRPGDRFTSDELARGEVELERPPPRPEPEYPTEPWGRLADLPPSHRARILAWIRQLTRPWADGH